MSEVFEVFVDGRPDQGVRQRVYAALRFSLEGLRDTFGHGWAIVGGSLLDLRTPPGFVTIAYAPRDPGWPSVVGRDFGSVATLLTLQEVFVNSPYSAAIETLRSVGGLADTYLIDQDPAEIADWHHLVSCRDAGAPVQGNVIVEVHDVL